MATAQNPRAVPWVLKKAAQLTRETVPLLMAAPWIRAWALGKLKEAMQELPATTIIGRPGSRGPGERRDLLPDQLRCSEGAPGAPSTVHGPRTASSRPRRRLTCPSVKAPVR